MDRPNIVLIHADQHRYDCLGAHGYPILRTPNLDRLVRQGVDFRHAFAPIPLCVPSRCSLLTGCWPTTHGCLVNIGVEGFQTMREDLPTWSALLQHAGYWLGYVGEWHVHPARTPLDYGFHEFVPLPAYDAWRGSRGLPPRPACDWFGGPDQHIRPEESRLAWSADEAVRMVRQAAGGSQPFLVRWDPVEPHLPNVVPEPFASMYPPEAVPPWPGFHDDLAGKPYIQAQQRRTWGLEGWTWDQWAPVVARYLGEVSLLDRQVGRLLDAVDELGLADETLVIYASDHGDLCGSHGMIDKHFIMYDDVVRVPLILRWPGRLAAGMVREDFISSALDLAATICRAAGLEPPATFAGRSLLEGPGAEGSSPRQDIFATYHGSQFGLYTQRMLRDRRWKYVWNATAEDELYDLDCDPGEVRNLAAGAANAAHVAHAAHAKELGRLRRRLVEWMEATHDPVLNDWTRRQILQGRKR